MTRYLSPIARRYVRLHGSEEEAVHAFASDLMADDPHTHKRGYTRENAVLAAASTFEITVERAYELIP